MDLLHWSSLESHQKIVGIDEAGRGCLCGPVYAAAVVFNPKFKITKPYKDSKLLSEELRDHYFKEILEHHYVGVGFATSLEVDRVNVLQATFLAMRRSIDQLRKNHSIFDRNPKTNLFDAHVIVDGNHKINQLNDFSQSALIKGDQLVAEISAASIIAKVSRDTYLKRIDSKYPEYEFSKHKGYGTQLHKKRIEEFGPCPEHRITFKGVREFI